MRKELNLVKVFSLIILLVSIWSFITVIHSNNNITKENIELIALVRIAANFLTSASLVHFTFNEKKNVKHLILPCILVSINNLGLFGQRLIDMFMQQYQSSFTAWLFLFYCIFGSIIFILIALDLKEKQKRIEYDINIIKIYWTIGAIAIVEYNVLLGGIYGIIYGILMVIGSFFSPIILIAFILSIYSNWNKHCYGDVEPEI